MINDTYLDNVIREHLMARHLAERGSHVSSGKLSAGMLGQPLQWQILKTIGIPQREFDEYTLRKFERGKQVEDWLLSHIPKESLVSSQEFVTYRDCLGIMDAYVDTTKAGWVNLGVIPHEIKSVTNQKFKRIVTQHEADISHRLQATLYALAKKSTHYAIDYVAADDLRVYTMIYETKHTEEQVNRVIDDFHAAMNGKKIPVFVSELAWQKNVKYNNYSAWTALTEEEAIEKLKRDYPTAYERMMQKEVKI